MHPRIVLSIALKDLRSAARDGRILLALLLPLGLGLLYNVVMPESQTPKVTVAVSSVDVTAVSDSLKAVAGSALKLSFKSATDASEVRNLVDSKKADVGLVVPAGFDKDVVDGRTPTLVVIKPASGATFGADYVIASLDAALRAMAGQHPPATVSLQTTAPASTDISSVMAVLGVRKYMVLGTLIMLIAMIAIYILPILLTEEYEKKTVDALLLIGSQADVAAGKALVGVAYVAVSVPLLLVVTRIPVSNPPLFAAAIFALTVTLLGFGLLMGVLVRTIAQLNTWSSLPLLLVIMPVFLIALGLPSWVQLIQDATPGSQAMRLLVDSASGTTIYGNWLVGFGVLAAWAAAGYAVLIRTMSRREA
jgi:ABC-2 type transport system permease protein